MNRPKISKPDPLVFISIDSSLAVTATLVGVTEPQPTPFSDAPLTATVEEEDGGILLLA